MKEVQNQTNGLEHRLTEEEPDPKLKYFKSCADSQIVAQPTFAKI